MEKIWDVTIMKMGSIQIEAETEDEAIKKADVTAEPLSDNQSTTPTASASISIVKVLAKINSPDVFKYVPVAGDTPLSVLAFLLRVW